MAALATCRSGRDIRRCHVDADVVDQHRLRKGYRAAGTFRGDAADGHVDHRKKSWSKTQGFPPRSPGVTVAYAWSSRNQRILAGSHATEYTWKPSARLAPARCDVVTPSQPEYPGPCTVPCTVAGSLPKFSMMSISPHCGQPTSSMSWPSIQNAGQIPRLRGSRIRAWNSP